jgi:DNA-binding IclR family transcriptional regulator
MRTPTYSSAPGKAILAALPEGELDDFFEQVTLKEFTPTTFATPGKLRAELASISQRGYSLDRAEGLEGIHCVAAVILDSYHYPVAALTVIGPSFRVTESRFFDIGLQCIAAAAEARARLLE